MASLAESEPRVQGPEPTGERPRLVLVGRDPQLEEALRTPGGPRLVARLEEVAWALPVLAQIRPEVVVAAESAAPGEPFASLLAGVRTLLPAARLVAVTSGALTYDVAGVQEVRLPWSVADVLRAAGWQGSRPSAPDDPRIRAVRRASQRRLRLAAAGPVADTPAPAVAWAPAPAPAAAPAAPPAATPAAPPGGSGAGEREASWQALERLRREEGAGRAPVRTLRPQVVALVGAKGGAGKTSLAVNLAALLAARTEAKVLLVDLGLEGPDASVQLELLDSPGLVDLLPFAGRLESAEAQAAVRHHRLGFDAVGGPPRPELAELIDPHQVGLLLRGALSRYDLTLVDTGPSLPAALRRVVGEAATQLLLLTTAEPAALRRLHLALHQEEAAWPRERLRLVLTRLSAAGPVPPAQAARELGFERWFELPEADEALERSAYIGRPLVLDQPDHPFSRAAERLAAHLIPFERAESRWTERLRDGWSRLSAAWIRERPRRG
ncbi:MAG: AAA family ATPase [Bacillota bacterium]|nr:AAA family ATPase [Bacillota bacterium]